MENENDKLASSGESAASGVQTVRPGERLQRHILSEGQPISQGGWQECTAWWNYYPPKHPCGPDPTGWQNFVVATVYALPESGRFLAVSFGAHWERGVKRAWAPKYGDFKTLEAAMNFCENACASNGIIPKPLLVGRSGSDASTQPTEAK